MLEFIKASEGHMKEPNLNMESLSKPELLTLFSILEGELEARDLVIEALRAQHRDVYVQERYGKYNLSDPFLALQRDGEAVGGGQSPPGVREAAASSNPLVVLKLVVSHCRRMQEKMLAQLSAAESRHRMVIADLEEERRRHAEDTAEGDDVTYILEKERERLLQQLEFERGQVRHLEKEAKSVQEQLEEERAQHKQLSTALAKECKWASSRALEEGHRLAEAGRRLQKEQEAARELTLELDGERRRALQMEARVERQLAESDTEREQLRSRLRREEARGGRLQEQVDALRGEEEVCSQGGHVEEVEGRDPPKVKTTVEPPQPPSQAWSEQHLSVVSAPLPKTNGLHHGPTEDLQASADRLDHVQDDWSESSTASASLSPALLHTLNLSPCSTGPPSLTSSPCSSPVMPKRPPGCPGSPSPNYQSSYQAGINQRFHAARHKFQGSVDPELQGQGGNTATTTTSSSSSSSISSLPYSPRELSPPLLFSPSPEVSPVKQQARTTVTQVLSRFTVPQGSKPPTPNSSPFGTDYRNMAPSSPVISRAAAGAALPLGVRSPVIPRADRGNPPPIPPKKPGLAQSPASPLPVSSRASHFPELAGSCGLTSSQENVKELDMVVSSTS